MSGKDHKLSPGAKRLISTHINQKPLLQLDKFACQKRASRQFNYKDISNDYHKTERKLVKSSNSKCNQNKTLQQIEKNSCVRIDNKKSLHSENVKEVTAVLPLPNNQKIDDEQNSPKQLCQLNDSNKVKSKEVGKVSRKYSNRNSSYVDKVCSSAEYKKEYKNKSLGDLQLKKEKNISHNKKEQRDPQIKKLSKELEAVRSAWRDDKKKFNDKIRKLEEKLNKKDREIQELKSQLNQQVGTDCEEITNLKSYPSHYGNNQLIDQSNSEFSEQPNILTFELDLCTELDNAEEEKTPKSNCNESLKRKFVEVENSEMNGKQKRQNVLNSLKVHNQAATELTPPLTPTHKSIQNFFSTQSNNLDSSPKISKIKMSNLSGDMGEKSLGKLSSVVFDLETNGLKREYHNVIQISALDVSDISSPMFNAYICPSNEFDPNASAVNGFYMKNGCLYKNGNELSTVTENKAIICFLNWLEKRKGKCILIAHNGKRFDVPRLIDLVKKHKLSNFFGELVHGFVDTLKLFKSLHPHIDKFTQSHLVKEILGIEYEAHDGIEDVIALAKLTTHNTVSEESIINIIDQKPITDNLKGVKLIDKDVRVNLMPLYAPNITSEEISMCTPENEIEINILRKLTNEVVIDKSKFSPERKSERKISRELSKEVAIDKFILTPERQIKREISRELLKEVLIDKSILTPEKQNERKIPRELSKEVAIDTSMLTPEKENKFPKEFPGKEIVNTDENDSQSKVLDNEENVMVTFDLETTGLDRYYHEVVQISAVEVNDLSEKFNTYILPKNEFDPYATKVNGLHLLNGNLCKKYYKLETVSEIEAIHAFINWLSKRKGKVIFLAHNGKNFDMPRIMDICRKGDVVELFKSHVIGHVDTLHLFRNLHPKRHKYTQESLVKDLMSINYNAHDGLEDVIALAKLLKHQSVTIESITSYIHSV